MVIFQPIPSILLNASELHLHSNMVIFQLFKLKVIVLSAPIYIPIWLYFNSNKRPKPPPPLLDLHSNMVIFQHIHYQSCTHIYYYLHSNMVIFQLGIGSCRHTTGYQFTFQYGYISTVKMALTYYLLANLHSNMVIFQLKLLFPSS